MIIIVVVSNFKRKDNIFIPLKINDHFVPEPRNMADAFANHFKSIFNICCLPITFPPPILTDLLPTEPISATEVSGATKHLKPSKCVG
jgi:hypothetical protein